jgi:choline transport protein
MIPLNIRELTVSAANGGPPGVLYELMVACAYYAVVGASIAEVPYFLLT